jgi:hypothetical protein
LAAAVAQFPDEIDAAEIGAIVRALDAIIETEAGGR